MSEAGRDAIVVGAGLAGAAVCVELARHGWSVTLVDAAPGPASGASALPVGMLSPHVTRAPTPLSRLSELGVADTLNELRRLVPEGQGWRACEVDNLNHDPGRWPAALVRPGALVNAWLQEAAQRTGLTCLWNHRVLSLRHRPPAGDQGGWVLQTDQASTPLHANAVFLCAAYGTLPLLQQQAARGLDTAFPLRPVKGQLSLAPLSGAPLAERPQRDDGVFVPCYEDTGLAPGWPQRIWAMGSTYTRGDSSTHVTPEDHRRNLRSLEHIHPAAAGAFLHALEEGTLTGWAQVRCASLDRLPLVGAVPDLPALNRQVLQRRPGRHRLGLNDIPRLPGLYTLCAVGSRGITLAHWCARALVAGLHSGETLNAHTDLLAHLDPARFALRQLRRQGQVVTPG